jgi:Flp pilus assembly pilin Flp
VFDQLIDTEVRHEDGQTMAEYAIVLGWISIAAVLVLGSISVIVTGQFEEVRTVLHGLIP